MRSFRLVALGFVAGAAVAFGVSLLRNRRSVSIDYVAPGPAFGPEVVEVPDAQIAVTAAEQQTSG